jgi:hypothetical protein
MMKGLVTRLDGVMLVGGLLGGLAGSFLAVRVADHGTPHVEVVSSAAGEVASATAPHEASAGHGRERDAAPALHAEQRDAEHHGSPGEHP